MSVISSSPFTLTQSNPGRELGMKRPMQNLFFITGLLSFSMGQILILTNNEFAPYFLLAFSTTILVAERR